MESCTGEHRKTGALTSLHFSKKSINAYSPSERDKKLIYPKRSTLLELRLTMFLGSPPDALTSNLLLVHFVDGTGQFFAPHFTGLSCSVYAGEKSLTNRLFYNSAIKNMWCYSSSSPYAFMA